MDHLGSGREWDLTRKNGGLNIVPPFAQKNIKMYTGRVEALASVLEFLRDQKEKYVVMSDANIAVNFDFKAFMDAHIASGADVTVAYSQEEIPAGAMSRNEIGTNMYYSFDIDNGRVVKLDICSKETGIQNFSMNIYIMDRELLIEQISNAYLHGHSYFERDILAPQLDTLNVQAYKYDGYLARICDLKSYFDENMKLLDEDNLDGLFARDSIYTKIRDDNPTRYIGEAKVKNTMAADGCVIEGEVENCVLFRGVRIAKGAKVKNCVLMQDTVVEEGAKLEYIISDKDVSFTAGKELRGSDSFPVYVAKHQTV